VLVMWKVHTPLGPRRERLKHPRRSPDKLSAPHCSTMAPGWYRSMILAIT
jgi:hypothetical protein